MPKSKFSFSPISEPLSPTTQDYLKHIFELCEHGGVASTNDLAARLRVAPASVSGMLKKLASAVPPLVLYRKHHGATLTPEGQRFALEVIRHHRLLETWLVQALGYSWDEVHSEACRLEHVISEDFETRMAEALGHPRRDPHGDPIPDDNLILPEDESVSLANMAPQQCGIILRVDDEEATFLQYVEQIGLVPGAKVKVISYSPVDENMTLELQSAAQVVVGPAITSHIFLQITEDVFNSTPTP